jgi:hypothetical protein
MPIGINFIMGNELFWITVFITVTLSILVNILGDFWTRLLPKSLTVNAKNYLAPALGFATLIILNTVIATIIPIGSIKIVIWILILVVVILAVYSKDKKKIFQRGLIFSIYSLICGFAILFPVLLYGAYDAHNDTFTYLVHSQWLQDNAFSNNINTDNVTPYDSQVYLYQTDKLRMGGSFLLSFIQSAYNLDWSYKAYPGLMIVLVSTCCLGSGFPISQIFNTISRKKVLGLTILGSFGFGGLIFAANFGFLPEVIGLALGTALLLLIGFNLDWIGKENPPTKLIITSSIPLSILFAAVTYAYSELILFVLLSIILTIIISILIHKTYKQFLVFSSSLFGISLVILNLELLRTYSAIRKQFGAVVGDPIDWSIFGFIGHIIGIHGGAWDINTWAENGYNNKLLIYIGIIIIIVVTGFLVFGLIKNRKTIISIKLIPIFICLLIFLIGIIYYRFFAGSPFKVGVGQSWSQFKLSDWAGPFFIIIFLTAFTSVNKLKGKIYTILLTILIIIGLIGTGYISMLRMNFIVDYYQTKDLNMFYTNFRDTVNSVCMNDSAIYLEFDDSDIKFRQMALLYLNDKNVKSNWSNDGYIFYYIKEEKINQTVSNSDCVIRKTKKLENNMIGKEIGRFQVYYTDNNNDK